MDKTLTRNRMWLPLLAAAALAAGCARGRPAEDANALRGTMLPRPLAKPEFTLTDTHGRPFDFRKETAGKLALVYFGYTHCADICPVQMANIATVLRTMPYEVVSRTRVIFITVDPARDTPERLRSWLDNFDTRFVGLRGTADEVAAVEHALHVAVAVEDTVHGAAGGDYTVGHAAQVIAFTPDGLAHVAYPFGTRQEDWEHDLPALAGGQWAAPAGTAAGSGGGAATAGRAAGSESGAAAAGRAPAPGSPRGTGT